MEIDLAMLLLRGGKRMKKALIVIDYQNDFVDGSLGFRGAEALDHVIYEKISGFRADGGEIIFTMDTHADDYFDTVEGKNLPVAHCIKGSDGWQLYGETAKFHDSGITFEKSTFGSFDLANYLAEKDFDMVELCGLVSNICVVSNAGLAKAALPNAQIIVDAGAVGSSDITMQEKTFDILENLHIKIEGR